MQQHKNISRLPGFTLVELLIVIVIIAILAAITIVAYNGIQGRARAASATSDLTNIAKQIESYNVINGAYPTTVDQAKSIGAKTSIDYGNSRVILCATANTGFAVFIRDDQAGAAVYEVASGMSPQQLTSPPAWSSASICGSTPYGTIAWGNFWLKNYT